LSGCSSSALATPSTPSTPATARSSSLPPPAQTPNYADARRTSSPASFRGRFVFSSGGASRSSSERRRTRLTPKRRAKAARLLSSRYGYGRQIRPTRLGNRARVFEGYLLDRYGLTRSCWTRIQDRLDDREQELLVEQDTDQRFFLNTSIGAIGVGAFLASTWAWEAAHGVTHSSEVAGAAAPVAVALFISWLAYCAAIGPAESMSTLTCASVDTHVRELYERFGIDAPRTRTDECEAGKAIAAFIDAGTPIPDAMRERDGDTSSGGNGAPVSHASRIALPVVMFAAAVGFAAGSRLRRG